MLTKGENMRRFEMVSIDKLVPYEKNARTHSEQQVQQIADSIKEFGFVNPVLIDGNFGIIAGHGRVLGAKLLGMTEVPAVFVEDLSEAKKRAYILADNKLAEKAGWDIELVSLELEELENLGFDISLTGFDEIDRESDFISELLNNDMRNSDQFNSDIFSMTFCFPIEHKQRIENFIKQKTKDFVVAMIMDEVENYGY